LCSRLTFSNLREIEWYLRRLRSGGHWTTVPPDTFGSLDITPLRTGQIGIRIAPAEVRKIHADNDEFEIGIAIALREGKDAMLISRDAAVGRALDAAELLAQKDIEAAYSI
jgi:hypothetical protein